MSDEDVYDAYEDVVARARNYQPEATILGVQVQEMLDLEESTETIVGMNRDPSSARCCCSGWAVSSSRFSRIPRFAWPRSANPTRAR